MRTLAIAAAIAAVAAVPAVAAPDLMVEGRADQFTERVNIGDLNLASEADADTLRGRILAASGRVCASAHRENNSAGKLVGACTDSTYRAAKPAIAQAIAQVESGRQLAATAVLIRLASR